MRLKFRIALAVLGRAQASMGDVPSTPTERSASAAICGEAPDAEGLIGTDWTDLDKAGWVRDQAVALLRCRDHQRPQARAHSC